MAAHAEVAILAGGRSSRMGTNKALIPLAGKRIIEHVLERVTGLGERIFIISNSPGEYEFLGLPIYPDVFPGMGSLAGIHAALTAAGSEHTLIVACDMPFLNRALLEHLISLATGFDAVVPRSRGIAEGLHAVYSKACIAPIERHLRAGDRRVISFHPDVHLRYVDDDELDLFDPERLSFFNVNTPENLALARKLASHAR